MRFAISIPQLVGDRAVDPAWLRTHISRAEELGYHAAWAQEQVLGAVPMLNPVEAMTFVAACTERIRIGCAVFVTPLHNPVHLAKSLASLDQLSRGRLDVGVGTGGAHRPFAAFEVDGQTIVARFTEGLRLMKALWTEPRVEFDGRFWHLEDAAMEPKPVQRPHPPIWFGANHPSALRRTARLGDGFFGAGSTTTERFAAQVPVVREALVEAGRDPASFPIAKRIYIAVDDDADRAHRRMAEALERLYGQFGLRDIVAVAVTGPADACVEGVRAVAAAGAELVLFTTLFDEDEQMERLAAEVVPAFS